MSRNAAVFGIYSTRSSVELAIEKLRMAGFRTTDVSVLFPENRGSKGLIVEKSTKAPEGAATGASSGAVIGCGLAWLAGIGALAIPGAGPLIAAGPIVAALAGVGAGGALVGIAGGLVGLGFPEYEATRYDGRIRKGEILLSVYTGNSDWTKKAKDILERTGAEDISTTGEVGSDYAKTDRPIPREHTGREGIEA